MKLATATEAETSEALRELDSVLQLLEARLPANVGAPANQKLVKSLERDMVEYFKALDMALDWTAIENLYYKYTAE